jgi:hypothetical protein
VDDEEIEAEAGHGRRDPDLGRAEPILELAAVEQHLQRADCQAQCHETEEVERLAVGGAIICCGEDVVDRDAVVQISGTGRFDIGPRPAKRRAPLIYRPPLS